MATNETAKLTSLLAERHVLDILGKRLFDGEPASSRIRIHGVGPEESLDVLEDHPFISGTVLTTRQLELRDDRYESFLGRLNLLPAGIARRRSTSNIMNSGLKAAGNRKEYLGAGLDLLSEVKKETLSRGSSIAFAGMRVFGNEGVYIPLANTSRRGITSFGRLNVDLDYDFDEGELQIARGIRTRMIRRRNPER